MTRGQHRDKGFSARSTALLSGATFVIDCSHGIGGYVDRPDPRGLMARFLDTGAALLAWAVPGTVLAAILVGVLVRRGGWADVEFVLTRAGDALLTLVAVSLVGASLAAGRRQSVFPSAWLVCGLSAAVLASLFDVQRLASFTICLAAVAGVRIMKDRGRAVPLGALALFPLLIGIAFLSLAVLFGGIGTGSEVARVRSPATDWEFVLVVADQGATGGDTTGVVERTFASLVRVAVVVYVGEFDSRPSVRWVGTRALAIDGHRVDVWKGSVVDQLESSRE